jgi:uncharacterized repeat protein (TIGR03803 family)
MTKLDGWKRVSGVLLLCAALAVPSHAQIFTTLLEFNVANGADPKYTSLVQGPDGNLYGTTSAGGDPTCAAPYGCGTVFKMTPGGALTTLHTFESADGAEPVTGLVLGIDGNFYGTTVGGGSNNDGTVFKMTMSGKFTTLHSFNSIDGTYATGPLVQGTDGSFYGVTAEGGDLTCSNFGCGTVFKTTPRGEFTTLHTFEFDDGAFPQSGLIQGTNGEFYGTTYGGGTEFGGQCYNGCGTVFKMTAEGALTTLYLFCPERPCTGGYEPYDALVEASDGKFYGTTTFRAMGSQCVCGTVFQVTATGKLATIHTFKNNDGADPTAGLIQATDGNLYGVTSAGGDLTCFYGEGCGTIFRIARQGGALTTLYAFDSTNSFAPAATLLQATNGTFYGTTYAGGNSMCFDGCGTVFSLDVGLGPFVSFVHNPAKVGGPFGILGQGFTGTTSVSLNGTPASFTVVSDTFIRATVPAGATTGYVTVTTSSGTLTSNVPFHVIP